MSKKFGFLLTAFLVPFAGPSSAFAQAAQQTQYVCTNTDNGQRVDIVTLDKANAQVSSDTGDDKYTAAAEFRPDNTVYWIRNVNQDDISATIKLTLNLSEKVLHTFMEAHAASGQTQTSEMLWSCSNGMPK